MGSHQKPVVLAPIYPETLLKCPEGIASEGGRQAFLPIPLLKEGSLFPLGHIPRLLVYNTIHL